jgi:hypothetical protein
VVALTNSGHVGATGATGASGAQGPGGTRGPPGQNGTNGRDGSNGANGRNGTNGSRGPPGPGAIANQTYDVGSTALNTTCVPYAGSDVNFTVSGPGILVVTAAVGITLYHTYTNYTLWAASFGNGSRNCNAFLNNSVSGEAIGTAASGYYWDYFGLAQSFPLRAAGTYTIDVVGYAYMNRDLDVTYFTYASVTGVFYPS